MTIYYVKLSEDLTVRQKARSHKEAADKATGLHWEECSPYILVAEQPIIEDVPDEDAQIFCLENFKKPKESDYAPTFIGFKEGTAFVPLRIAE